LAQAWAPGGWAAPQSGHMIPSPTAGSTPAGGGAGGACEGQAGAGCPGAGPRAVAGRRRWTISTAPAMTAVSASAATPMPAYTQGAAVPTSLG